MDLYMDLYMMQMAEHIEELEKRDAERAAEHERKKREMDATLAFLRKQMETMGYEVPKLDVETPISSVGQVGTSNSGHDENIDGEDVDEEENGDDEFDIAA